jgi:hypothetical protein
MRNYAMVALAALSALGEGWDVAERDALRP